MANARPNWMLKSEFWCRECLRIQQINFHRVEPKEGAVAEVTVTENHSPNCSRASFQGKETEPFEVE